MMIIIIIMIIHYLYRPVPLATLLAPINRRHVTLDKGAQTLKKEISY